MASAFLMTSLLKKLSSLIPQASSSASMEQELYELGVTMKRIHDMLDDAEERDITDKYSEQLHLRELKEVVYDAEDVMDEYEYEVLRAKVEARRRLLTTKSKHVDKVFSQNFDHPKVPISYGLAHRVKKIRNRFEEITYEWGRISLQAKDGKRRRVKMWKPMETTSYFNDANTFGREDEKRQIIEWLLQEDEQCNVSVLPIVGMGGIGKTTVAQMVYNDPIVHQKFRLTGWVCVSEDFDIVSLMRKIILSFSFMELDYKISSTNELHKILKDSLNGEDLFLVLDDVWNQKSELWDSLKVILVGIGASKIIVTTRNESVAKIMQTTPPIYLSNLSFNNCWLLFTKIAFEGRQHDTNDVFVDIGKKIVKKCGGLPLAVKVLASTLSYEQDENIWIDTLESELWELDDEKSYIMPALKLSYDRMPMKLRSCFMYLSLFPKDSRIERSTIIEQWMSQGFLHQREENVREEDIGNAYYDELLQRSMIQCDFVSSKDTFIMHDLIHDLAQLVATDDHLLITSDELHFIPKTIRHVSIHLNRNSDVTNLKSLFDLQLRKECLRTLILHSVEGFPIANLLHNLTCLRTLSLKDCKDSPGEKKPLDLFDSLGNLKHIRYLYVYTNKFVPESLYKLYHLQTFMGSLNDMKLTGGIGDLINLRHLNHDSTYTSKLYLPYEVGWLTNLQTLRTFSVGAGSWQCKVKDLKHLDNLRGELRIQGLETVKWWDVTPPEALLNTKSGIQNLYIWWSENVQQKVDDDGDDKLAKQVLECLQPHTNLVKLSIREYPGSIFPMWLGGASFSKLKHLQLEGGNCLSLPTLGRLPSLKSLCIMQMQRVKSVGRELLLCDSLNPVPAATEGVSSFLSLEELTFREMEEWMEWLEVEDSDFPCLRVLCIENCPKLQRLPSLASLTELTFYFHGWTSELLSGCCRLPMLRTLKIIYYTGDSLSFPNSQIFRSLEDLVISMSRSLQSIMGLGNLTSLRHLEIGGCPSLRIPPEERLPHDIKDVKILGCPEAEKWYHNRFLERSEQHHQMVEMKDISCKEEK